MSVLKIIYYPNDLLRKFAQPVLKVDDSIRKIIDDMFDTMYQNNGIGLAATQVNIHKSIAIIDISENKDQRIVLINPKIIKKNGSFGIHESCLSIPNKSYFILRSKIITVKAMDLNGKYFEFNADGLLSVCIQHEIDHLIGKLFIDYL